MGEDQRPERGIGGKGNYIKCYTVTARMISPLRWASVVDWCCKLTMSIGK